MSEASSYRPTVQISVVLIVLFLLIEVVSYASILLLQSKWLMWSRPIDTPREMTYEAYMAGRHPILGWPREAEHGVGLDVNGAQLNPVFPLGGVINQPCVTLYGDSFTQGGDTTDPSRNWGNVLSRLLDCYVANFGVGGYGTDQAFLRFKLNSGDTSPKTVFGFHPADVIRNITRIRDLETSTVQYALKPRFILGGQTEELVLIDIPELSEQQYLQAIGAQLPIFELEHEDMQPGGTAGVALPTFPFSYALFKNITQYYRFRARLAGETQWHQFLQPGHASDAFEITAAITREFAALAEERGKSVLVVVLPHLTDIEQFLHSGDWSYQSVLDDMSRASIAYIDFGPQLIAAAKDSRRSVQSYFGPTLHYNDDGNELVARFVERALRDPQE